jgi:hypothetical protein
MRMCLQERNNNALLPSGFAEDTNATIGEILPQEMSRKVRELNVLHMLRGDRSVSFSDQTADLNMHPNSFTD